MMRKGLLRTAGVAALALVISAGGARADGMTSRKAGTKDAPVAADDGRKWTFSWNIGGTTDYVFRGFSQTRERPAFQAGADIAYGILYAGFWGSQVDFGRGPDGRDVGGFAEIDWYLGIKPVWGKATFDLGVIYYSYPGTRDGGVRLNQDEEYDYFELKAGVSGEVLPKLTLGGTVFWSPEYTNKQGETVTLEGTAAYELPKVWLVTPSITGTLGAVIGDANDLTHPFLAANGRDSYLYWNAGLALAADKVTLDFRYWDTNVNQNGRVGTNFCTGPRFQCDERFVFSTKFTF